MAVRLTTVDGRTYVLDQFSDEGETCTLCGLEHSNDHWGIISTDGSDITYHACLMLQRSSDDYIVTVTPNSCELIWISYGIQKGVIMRDVVLTGTELCVLTRLISAVIDKYERATTMAR